MMQATSSIDHRPGARPSPGGSPGRAVAASEIQPARRLVVLDVLRGFALLGVLVVNLPFAALPMEAALAPTGGASSPLPELGAWALVKGLGETKFVSLFSLLFGIGLVLQIGRAEARGASTSFYLRRLFILGVVGLLHGLLLWPGDILLPYAVAGFMLYLVRGRSPRVLVTLAVPLFLVGIVLSTGMAYLDGDGQGSRDEPAAVAEMLGSDETWNELEARAWKEGPLALTLGVRAFDYVAWLMLSSLISFNWHVMALFLVGAALMKLGSLDSACRGGHRRLAIFGIAGGLALEAAAIGLELTTDFAHGLPGAASALLHEVGSLTLAAGYLGAVVWAVHGEKIRLLHRPFAAVGRTALSCYLGQSLAFNFLFPWFGLGLWGQLGRPQLIVLGLGIYALQMLIASLWLRRFAMGPCEWLWRWLTYGRRPALLAVEA